jgi:hypothetical protein
MMSPDSPSGTTRDEDDQHAHRVFQCDDCGADAPILYRSVRAVDLCKTCFLKELDVLRNEQKENRS